MKRSFLILSLVLFGCSDSLSGGTDTDSDMSEDSTTGSPGTTGNSGPFDPFAPFGPVPCIVDADCGGLEHCALGLCYSECLEDEDCESSSCSERGRCEEQDFAWIKGKPLVLDPPFWKAETDTGDLSVTNNNPFPVKMRLQSSGAEHTNEIVEVPGNSTLSFEVTFPSDQGAGIIPVSVISEVGSSVWGIENFGIQDGHFTGTVTFTQEDFDAHLGTSTLGLMLKFEENGTVSGALLSSDSFLWKDNAVVEGTWDEEGFTFTTKDAYIPENNFENFSFPLNRKVARHLTFTGTFEESRLVGEISGVLKGYAPDPIPFGGQFAVTHRGGWEVPQGEFAQDLNAPFLSEESHRLEDVSQACEEHFLASSNYCSPALGMLSENVLNQSFVIGVANCSNFMMNGIYNPPAILDSDSESLPPFFCFTDQDCCYPGEDCGVSCLDNRCGDKTWDECITTPSQYENSKTCLDFEGFPCVLGLNSLGQRFAIENDMDLDVVEGFKEKYFADFDKAIDAALLVAPELQSQAAFVYQNGGLNEDLQAKEFELLERSLFGLAELSSFLNSSFFIENYDDQIAPTKALELQAQHIEAFSRWLPLQQRYSPNEVDLGLASKDFAFVAFVQGAFWAYQAGKMGDNDALGLVKFQGRHIDTLRALSLSFGKDKNPWGYSENHVPMAVSIQDVQEGRTNFELLAGAAYSELEKLNNLEIVAAQRFDEYLNKSYSLQTETFQINEQFNSRLRVLCGTLDDSDEPDIERCGDGKGEIGNLKELLGAFKSRAQQAVQAVANNEHAIAVEEERIGNIISSHEALENKIDQKESSIFNWMTYYNERKSAARTSYAMAECTRIKDALVKQLDVLDHECDLAMQQQGKGYSVFGWGVPDPAGMGFTQASCDAKEQQLEAAARQQCESLEDHIDMQNSLDELENLQQQQLVAVSNEMEELMRQNNLDTQTENSKAIVKNMLQDSILLGMEIEETVRERKAARIRVMNARKEANSLLIDRAQALAKYIHGNPNNTSTQPRFIRARMETARDLMRRRQRAQIEIYRAIRALEYEINHPLDELRLDLEQAMSSKDLEEVLSCATNVFEDYKLNWQPSIYETTISLKHDVFGIPLPQDNTLVDPVTGLEVTPDEQFQAILSKPENQKSDGIHIPFTLGAFENTLFSQLLCGDRINFMKIKLLGEYQGDNEAEILMKREGLAGIRSCQDDGNLTNYSFDPKEVIFQAGVNEETSAGPNVGFAHWPVNGDQWILVITNPDESPSNSDLDIAKIRDVVLTVQHQAATASSQPFSPSCN